jgi:radical SAM superfamily enzyme YgiQ (UPF0313 family)
MNKTILFLTPPFTQLNTPYPATAYLKGFMNTLNVTAHQADLGIEVILALFSSEGLRKMFKQLEASDIELSDNAYRIYALRELYIQTIDPVIRFLQHKNPTLAFDICTRKYLPEAFRFNQLDDLEWAFGSMGIQDRARHYATLYLEDLGDLITEGVDAHFGFSRYAERLGRTATHFDEMQTALDAPDSLVMETMKSILKNKMEAWKPDIVGISVPFPGNLYGALKCGQFLKNYYPKVQVVLGGGYANTELRSISEDRFFDYIDFLSLDDGEAPFMFLLEHLNGFRPRNLLKRIFARTGGVVCYHNGALEKDVAQRATGTPDYSDLPLQNYLSVLEVANPMHRLWSDGRWNKLTLAHGCYWGKCSFCDITLDYIKNYEPLTAALLCDRIETLIEQTQQNGFHFVDEAAPPALMRDLAIEIIRRRLTVTWWTNIRFEKSFTPDLCILLKASGCIAVSGGLEVASDRLLARMQKGVTVAQVARVAQAFTQSGIMVHAYLMYGFPTQTEQETIDSLEMVRQLFQSGAVQSGFWHQFAMTSHSPVGQDPAAFEVQRVGPDFGGFADNDLYHEDPIGGDHERFSEGLKKSLFNYMHNVGFDMDLSEWFDFEIPATSIDENYIETQITAPAESVYRPNALVIWLGQLPELNLFTEKIKRKSVEMAELVFYQPKGECAFVTDVASGQWWASIMKGLVIGTQEPMTFQAVKKSFEESALGDFQSFLNREDWIYMKANGLLVI